MLRRLRKQPKNKQEAEEKLIGNDEFTNNTGSPKSKEQTIDVNSLTILQSHNADPSQMTSIDSWLKEKNLEQLIPEFQRRNVTISELQQFNENELKFVDILIIIYIRIMLDKCKRSHACN